MNWVLAPEGLKNVAQGVSPGKTRSHGRTVCLQRFPGLTPWATFFGPSGARTRRYNMTDDTQRTPLLVIDDDKKLCRLIKDYLDPLGYEVVAAHTGKDGLERALAEHFDAILLDIMMPEMDGLE